MSTLKEKLFSKIEPKRKEVKKLIKEYGNNKIGEVTVSQAYGGMRGIKCMVWEPSALDPEEGIKFRGCTIPNLRKVLPKAAGGEEPLPEGLFYLLLTGDLPTEEDAKDVDIEWMKRREVPKYLFDVIDGLPKDTHPMTQLSIGILALQPESIFSKRYHEGMQKEDYWDAQYEDTMNLLGKLPSIAAYIYRRSFKDGVRIRADENLDWAANYAHMMGIEAPEYKELMRLYLTIHADHEGGNASAHSAHLVGSTLSDAYFSLSSGMAALAGPLHGLANQEVLIWIQQLQKTLGGGVPSKEQLTKYVWETLNNGQVIPGYGHAVLRKTDPRYTAQREFALRHLPDDELFQIVSLVYEVVPDALREHGKAKNPWPNVDAHSGCLQWHYGVKEYDYYTVMFGVSRAMGVLASSIWSRALGLPLERPKSVTTEWIKDNVHSNGEETEAEKV